MRAILLTAGLLAAALNPAIAEKAQFGPPTAKDYCLAVFSTDKPDPTGVANCVTHFVSMIKALPPPPTEAECTAAYRSVPPLAGCIYVHHGDSLEIRTFAPTQAGGKP
jgi:hypothetical protein